MAGTTYMKSYNLHNQYRNDFDTYTNTCIIRSHEMDPSVGLGLGKTDKEKAEVLLSFQKAIQSQKQTLKLLGVCFDRCVPTPGEVLTTSQQSCLWRCAQRNLETQYFILKRLEGMAAALKPGQ